MKILSFDSTVIISMLRAIRRAYAFDSIEQFQEVIFSEEDPFISPDFGKLIKKVWKESEPC